MPKSPERPPSRRGGRRRVNRLPPAKRVADIMAAAREVFTEKGYNDALISDIAERAGIVEGSIYRFFTNKRDLLIKMIEEWYETILARDEQAFNGIKGTWNRIRFVIHHHLMTIRDEPALSRLVFQELRPERDYRHTRVFQLNQAYTHRIIDIVRSAVASGEFRSDISPSLVRDMIFGAVEHRTWSFLRGEGQFGAEETADEITNLIYRGLAASQSSDPSGTMSSAGKGGGSPRGLTEGRGRQFCKTGEPEGAGSPEGLSRLRWPSHSRKYSGLGIVQVSPHNCPPPSIVMSSPVTKLAAGPPR